MIKPNFFIIGAPKCGTTALSEYLRAHPKVFVSRPKEPHYFSDDLIRPYPYITTLDEYLSLFEKAKPEHLAVGESSVEYLYSSVAVRNIYQFNPNAKLIVMFRNPIDMLYSMHSQMLYDLEEDEKDFQTAWSLQPERAQGRRIPERCRERKFLQYKTIGRIGEHLEKVLQIFPIRQVKVIIYDDFARSPSTLYEDVLKFLGVPSDGRTEFPRLNESRGYRSAWLARLQSPPHGITQVVKRLKRALGVNSLGVLKLVGDINGKKISRLPLPPEFRQELANEFRDDIKKLSRILNRDLSHWCE